MYILRGMPSFSDTVTYTCLSAMSSLPCSYCSGEFSAPSEELLLTHIRLVHSCDPGFSILCSHHGCSRSFSSFKSYQNHRRLEHKSIISPEQPIPDPDGEFEDRDDVSIEAHTTNTPSTGDMPFLSRWILKTRETREHTRTAIQGVIEDVEDLVTQEHWSLRHEQYYVQMESSLNQHLVWKKFSVLLLTNHLRVCSHFISSYNTVANTLPIL